MQTQHTHSSQELPDQGLLNAYGNMIYYAIILVDLTNDFLVLRTCVKVYSYDNSSWWVELNMNINEGNGLMHLPFNSSHKEMVLKACFFLLSFNPLPH